MKPVLDKDTIILALWPGGSQAVAGSSGVGVGSMEASSSGPAV